MAHKPMTICCYAESDQLNSPKKYGMAVKYVSYFTKACNPDHSYCQHSIFVRQLYPISDHGVVVNEEAGASHSGCQARKVRTCGAIDLHTTASMPIV